MTELLLIRHGETDWNRALRFQGHSDIPLNAQGLAQAESLAARLADEPLDLVVTSDLLRTRQTAQPLLNARAVPTLADAGWREQAFGVLEGLDAETIRQRHPEVWTAWLRHDADLAPPGGESNRQFHSRVLAALRALVAAQAGRRIAVVTHGGVLDMLWRTVHALPLSGPRRCLIPNTGLNRLRWTGAALAIVAWGDDAHVSGAQPLRPALD